MRSNPATKGRWWWLIATCGVLLWMGFSGSDVPQLQAQLRYSGGFVQTRRDPDAIAPRMKSETRPSATTIPPHLTTPDNDFDYRSYYPVGTPTQTVSSSRIPTTRLETMPWNRAGFKSYDELQETLGDSTTVADPRKYALTTASVELDGVGNPLTATLVVHLPERALLWVEGVRVNLQADTSQFQSPSLPVGKKYVYTVRVAWLELGRWVSQSRKVSVQAGSVQALYLHLSAAHRAMSELNSRIEASMAKLSPEDQRVAKQQKICVVRHDVLLGDSGVPVKVMLNNHRVFVCDEKCVKHAQENPDLSLAKAQILRARSVAESSTK